MLNLKILYLYLGGLVFSLILTLLIYLHVFIFWVFIGFCFIYFFIRLVFLLTTQPSNIPAVVGVFLAYLSFIIIGFWCIFFFYYLFIATIKCYFYLFSFNLFYFLKYLLCYITRYYFRE